MNSLTKKEKNMTSLAEEEVVNNIMKPQSKGTEAPHVAMFPWLPFGHVNPFIQLSNQLAQHGFTISFLTPRENLQKIKPFNHFPEKIHMVPLDVNVDPSDSDKFNSPAHALHNLLLATNSLKGQVESAITLLRPDIIIYEFAHYVPSIANLHGVKPVFYCVTSATAVAYHLVPACKPASVEDLTHPPPGHPASDIFLHPFEAKQILFAFDRYGGELSLQETIVKAMEGADLIIMKTCKEMEDKYCEYIREQYQKPLVLAGPILPEPRTDDTLDERWENWLSQFPTGSVLYCSFGSQDVLPKELLTELLLGLEKSEIPFMAVLQFPGDATQEEILPEGYLERVKDRGLIHSGWVQQQLLLSHKAVGGYLCHSGFGSLAEAVSTGCQLVLLPQKGDQFLNARLMSRDLKVGVEVDRRAEDGEFAKDAVYRAVRSVMVEVDGDVGREVRGNHSKLKETLLNKELQSGYMAQVVQELEHLAKGKRRKEIPE